MVPGQNEAANLGGLKDGAEIPECLGETYDAAREITIGTRTGK